MQRDPTNETAGAAETTPPAPCSVDGMRASAPELSGAPEVLLDALPTSAADPQDGDANGRGTTLTNRRAPTAEGLHEPEVTPMRADEGAGSSSLTQLDYPPPPPFHWKTPQAAPPVPNAAGPVNALHGRTAESWGTTTYTFSANTVASASYLLWWLSGLLVYFNERRNTYVRFHALQSIFFSAAATLFAALASIVSALFLEWGQRQSSLTLTVVGTVIAVLTAFTIVLFWSALMIAAWNGHLFRLPIVGRYAERYAAPPSQQSAT